MGFEKKGTAKVRVYTLVPESLALNGIDPSSVMLVKASPPPPPLVTESSSPPAAVVMATSLPDVLFEDQEETLALAEVEPPLLRKNLKHLPQRAFLSMWTVMQTKLKLVLFLTL